MTDQTEITLGMMIEYNRQLRIDLNDAQAESGKLLHLISEGVFCEEEDRNIPLQIMDESDLSVGLHAPVFLALADGYEVVKKCQMFRVQVIMRKRKSARTYPATDYIVIASSADEAAARVRTHTTELGHGMEPLLLGAPQVMGSMYDPIGWVTYMVDQKKVEPRLKSEGVA